MATGAAIGLSAYQTYDASRRAREAQRSSDSYMQRQLDFEQARQDDWDRTFGNIESNLAQYYESLGPEKIASMGLQKQQQSYEDAKLKLQQSLSQRGLTGSEFETYAESQIEQNNAYERARIRAGAEGEAASQKAQFLNIGLNEKSRIDNNISSIYSNASNNQSKWAFQYQNQFNQGFGDITNSLMLYGMSRNPNTTPEIESVPNTSLPPNYYMLPR